jgi:pimeloyl-ACP methyl ester carboxylesterase
MAHALHKGVRIHYRVVGEGPPLVLHHGFTQTIKRWYLCGYVEALRKDFQLILVDPRGHGASDKPHEPAAYALPLRVADVVAVLDGVNVATATFWGYSDGGRIAFGLAKYSPERISSLIIGGHDPYERRIPPSAKFDGKDRNAFLDALLRRINIDPAAVSQARRDELMANDFEALAAALQDSPSIEEVLPFMKMPCLLYAGEADPFYPAILRCSKSMPNVTVVGLPGLSHSDAFWQSALVVEYVLKFMRRCGLAADSQSAGVPG